MSIPRSLSPDPASPTSGIQEALDTLGQEGGIVHLLPGEYPVQTSVLLPNGRTLRGSGSATIIRLAAGAGRSGQETHVLRNQDPTTGRGLIVENLCVDGHHSGQAWEKTDLGGAGIVFDGADGVTVRNVEVRNTWRHGIWFLNGTGARIENCEVHTVGCSNISLGGQHHFRRFTEDVLIRGCRLSDSQKAIGRRAGNCGIEIKDHTRRVQVADCQSFHHREGYGFAVLVHAGKHPAQEVSDILLANCLAWGCIHGFAIGTTGDFPVRDVTLSGCHAFENTKSGVCIHAANGGKTSGIGVHGGIFHDNSEHGITMEGEGFSGIVLTANRISRNGLTGLAGPCNDQTVTLGANALWDNTKTDPS